MTLAAFGVVAGLAAAFSLTRVMASLLFNVRSHDPTTCLAYVRIEPHHDQKRTSRVRRNLLRGPRVGRETRPGDCSLANVTTQKHSLTWLFSRTPRYHHWSCVRRSVLRGFELCECSESVIMVRLTLTQ